MLTFLWILVSVCWWVAWSVGWSVSHNSLKRLGLYNSIPRIVALVIIWFIANMNQIRIPTYRFLLRPHTKLSHWTLLSNLEGSICQNWHKWRLVKLLSGSQHNAFDRSPFSSFPPATGCLSGWQRVASYRLLADAFHFSLPSKIVMFVC